jgi:biotin carboxyl carrier protein
VSEQNTPAQIMLESGTYYTRLTRKFMLRKPYEKHDPRVIKAIIPGAVERIDTAVGKKVRHGDTLMIQEAMKMHNRIKAPCDGRIKAVHVAAGDKVVKGQILIELE